MPTTPSPGKPNPSPPEPFSSWLDFAIAHLPVRDLELDTLFREIVPEFSRDDFRRAAQAELDELRWRAGGRTRFPSNTAFRPALRATLEVKESRAADFRTGARNSIR